MRAGFEGQKTQKIETVNQASAAFCAIRDREGLGSRDMSTMIIYDDDGKAIGWVSYNGKVWSGRHDDPRVGDQLVYDPLDNQRAACSAQPLTIA